MEEKNESGLGKSVGHGAEGGVGDGKPASLANPNLSVNLSDLGMRRLSRQ
jgi:hypothetical protein